MKVLKFYDNSTKAYITPLLSADKIIIDEDGNTLASKINQIEAKLTTGTEIAVIDGVSLYAPTSGETIIKTIDTYPITYFNTLSDFIEAGSQLKSGEIAATKGYYKENDGGGSIYYIMDSASYVDGITSIGLGTDLYALISIPLNETFNIRLFGGKNVSALDVSYTSGVASVNVTDNKKAIDVYTNFCTLTGVLYKLYIPAGIWCFSETTITTPVNITGENSDAACDPGISQIMGMPTIHQSFIFKLLDTQGSTMEDLFFQPSCVSSALLSLLDSVAYAKISGGIIDSMLVLDNVYDCHFDGLYFQNCRTAIEMGDTHDCYFGYINPRGTGKIIVTDNVLKEYNSFLFHKNIYNVYFEYMNFEGTYGTYFYGDSTDPDAQVQITIGDIQAESTGTAMTTKNYPAFDSLTDPGWSDSVYDKFFMFGGKLGSPEYPVMVNSISQSHPYTVMPVSIDGETLYCKYFGLVGNIAEGLNPSIILNNVYILPSITDANWIKGNGPFYIYDRYTGGQFTINAVTSKSKMCFSLNDCSMPTIATTGKSSAGVIYAQDCSPVRVSTTYRDSSKCPHGICGANEPDEYYLISNTANKQYVLTFYNSEGISSVTPIIQTYISSTDTYSVDKTLDTVSVDSTVGWVTVTLPVLSTSTILVKIKNLPKYIASFS